MERNHLDCEVNARVGGWIGVCVGVSQTCSHAEGCLNSNVCI